MSLPRGVCALLSVVGALCLATGCQTLHNDDPILTMDWKELEGQHKDDVYMVYGLPNKIDHVGDTSYLYYVNSASKGSGFVIGNSLVPFRFNRTNSGSDTNIIRVNQEDRVIGLTTLQRTPDLRFSPWPFGD